MLSLLKLVLVDMFLVLGSEMNIQVGTSLLFLSTFYSILQWKE